MTANMTRVPPEHKHGPLAICVCQLPATAAQRAQIYKRDDHTKLFRVQTLIPFFATHRSSMNDGFRGVYGRLSDQCQAGTLTTIAALNGKSGRLIHPHRDRIISVREAARLQGFPDHYAFSSGDGRRGETPRSDTLTSVTESDDGEEASQARSRMTTTAFRIIGNAIPPTLGRALILEVLKARAKEFGSRV